MGFSVCSDGSLMEIPNLGTSKPGNFFFEYPIEMSILIIHSAT